MRSVGVHHAGSEERGAPTRILGGEGEDIGGRSAREKVHSAGREKHLLSVHGTPTCKAQHFTGERVGKVYVAHPIPCEKTDAGVSLHDDLSRVPFGLYSVTNT